MKDPTGVALARTLLALVARRRERLGIPTKVAWYSFHPSDEDYMADLRQPGLGLRDQLEERVTPRA